MFKEFTKTCDKIERRTIHCNACKRDTIHNLEAQCKGDWEDPDSRGYDEFSIFRCGACDQICFEKAAYSEDDYQRDEDGEYFLVPIRDQYPSPSAPEFIFENEWIPRELDKLLTELVFCLSGRKFILATVALRMSVEFIVNDKKCLGKNLYEKIDALQSSGHVDKEQHALLHTIREKGNAGAHDNTPMTRTEMIAGISVINLLLDDFYNAPSKKELTLRNAKKILHKK